jgi:hypothetical protein
MSFVKTIGPGLHHTAHPGTSGRMTSGSYTRGSAARPAYTTPEQVVARHPENKGRVGCATSMQCGDSCCNTGAPGRATNPRPEGVRQPRAPARAGLDRPRATGRCRAGVHAWRLRVPAHRASTRRRSSPICLRRPSRGALPSKGTRSRGTRSRGHRGPPHPLSTTVAPFRAWRGLRCAVGGPRATLAQSPDIISPSPHFSTIGADTGPASPPANGREPYRVRRRLDE